MIQYHLKPSRGIRVLVHTIMIFGWHKMSKTLLSFAETEASKQRHLSRFMVAYTVFVLIVFLYNTDTVKQVLSLEILPERQQLRIYSESWRGLYVQHALLNLLSPSVVRSCFARCPPPPDVHCYGKHCVECHDLSNECRSLRFSCATWPETR